MSETSTAEECRAKRGNQGKVGASAEPVAKKAKTEDGQHRKDRWRTKDAEFHYGNYDRYYGKRAVSTGHSKNGEDSTWSTLEYEDPRLNFFKQEWFEGKKVLDIGCNVGFMTADIASRFSPLSIVGLDIDGKLVSRAKELMKKKLEKSEHGSGKNATKEEPGASESGCSKSATTEGPEGRDSKKKCLDRIRFETGNYVLSDESLIDFVRPEYDAILALSLTKWIHLNWGDDGVKRFFRRVHRHLHPGGIFIMEPQAWSTYKRKKGLTPEIAHNYDNIQFKPDRFRPYLLSDEVGFESCEVINNVERAGKGFTRPIYLFRKAVETIETGCPTDKVVDNMESTAEQKVNDDND